MRKLLILGAGIYQVPLIQKAKAMGLYTIVASYAGSYPGLALADEVWNIDTTDYRKLIPMAKKAGISGVCTSGTDVAVLSLGMICKELGLCGVSSSCARTVTDKALMKQALLSHHVSTPESVRVSSFEESQDVFRKFSPPVIVKAVDSSGSRGITRADSVEELKTAYDAARKVTKKDYVLVERFLEAQEIGVDGFISGGEIRFLLPHGKFTHTTDGCTLPEGHYFPYPCSPALYRDILLQTERAAMAVGMDNCAINADVLVQGDQAFILEIGARAGATCIPELITTYCGFDYYEQMIRQSLGETPDFTCRTPRPCMAKLLFSGKDGILSDIDEEQLAKCRTDCLDLSLDYPAGASVEKVQNGTSRIGQVIMETDDIHQLDEMMSRVRRSIRVDGTDLETLWTGKQDVQKPSGSSHKLKNYLLLHLNIMLFSFTGIFSKLASIQYNSHGLGGWMLYLFLFLMISNCGIYALAWQKIIKKFDLSTAYAHRSVYLIWSQLWAALIFRESLSWNNLAGMLVVLIGVLVVQKYE